MITNLSIGRYGRFGNQLFQIAGVIGIARKIGQPFGFKPWINHDHKERFGSTEDIDLAKHFVHSLPGLIEQDFTEYAVPWGYHDIYPDTSRNWNLTGHFQSEKYFSHCIDEVRHYFRMKEEAPIGYHNDKVAIHLRLGDYDNHYHTRLGIDYYWRAMEHFPDNTKYILFTDDAKTGERYFGNHANVSFSGEKDYIGDFCFMKQCGGFICGNSSFSLMAAILSEAPNKKIVCPHNWFGPAWQPDTTDLYPEGAIII